LRDARLAGWSRWLPVSALDLYAGVAGLGRLSIVGELSEQPCFGDFGMFFESLGGENGFAWRPEDFQDFKEGDLPGREAFVARAFRAAEAAGANALETNADLLRVLQGLGLVSRRESKGLVRWSGAAHCPTPLDCIPMPEEERNEEEAALRRIRLWDAARRSRGREGGGASVLA
jgi:hypothetical protein